MSGPSGLGCSNPVPNVSPKLKSVSTAHARRRRKISQAAPPPTAPRSSRFGEIPKSAGCMRRPPGAGLPAGAPARTPARSENPRESCTPKPARSRTTRKIEEKSTLPVSITGSAVRPVNGAPPTAILAACETVMGVPAAAATSCSPAMPRSRSERDWPGPKLEAGKLWPAWNSSSLLGVMKSCAPLARAAGNQIPQHHVELARGGRRDVVQEINRHPPRGEPRGIEQAIEPAALRPIKHVVADDGVIAGAERVEARWVHRIEHAVFIAVPLRVEAEIVLPEHLGLRDLELDRAQGIVHRLPRVRHLVGRAQHDVADRPPRDR